MKIYFLSYSNEKNDIRLYLIYYLSSHLTFDTISKMTSCNRFPSNLYELIEDTYKEYEIRKTETYANCLLSILKKYHLWPSMQIKKFKGRTDIVLLHNTYKRNDVSAYKELYNQCRSVILDFTLSVNNNIVVTYANSIPDRINYDTYMNNLYDTQDRYYEAYDGTMITVYNYKGEWHFGTTSCPDANSSKFAHPTKRHGNMLDEILFEYYRGCFSDEEIQMEKPVVISEKIRKMFTDNLDPAMAYEFLVVHHDNHHIIDYTPVFGTGYKVLFHINTKQRDTLVEQDINMSVIPALVNLGVRYPLQFSNIHDAYEYMNANANCYGLIVKKLVNAEIKLYKISTDKINFREETDPCNPNVWVNMLTVYMKNKADYHVNDYISHYASNVEFPVDNNGKTLDPTYLIHTAISTIKDSLFNLYVATTNYYPKYNRFKMNKELDKQFAPIIQYHLAQLRNQQVNIYKDRMITPSNVYYYLCQCNNVKNIKTLIQFFASNSINEMPPRTAMCFTVLNSLLS